MPFDISPKDITPAQRLAALIEAGVAANPDLKHGRYRMLLDGRACALGFAALAIGVSRERAEEVPSPYYLVAKFLALGNSNDLMREVWRRNDAGGASLPEICESLRSGELSKVAA